MARKKKNVDEAVESTENATPVNNEAPEAGSTTEVTSERVSDQPPEEVVNTEAANDAPPPKAPEVTEEPKPEHKKKGKHQKSEEPPEAKKDEPPRKKIYRNGALDNQTGTHRIDKGEFKVWKTSSTHIYYKCVKCKYLICIPHGYDIKYDNPRPIPPKR